MKNILKKINSKWFLLFLFTFLSVGMQAQYSEDETVNEWVTEAWDSTEEGTNSSWDVDDDGNFNETDFDYNDWDLVTTEMDNDQYDDWLASGGWEDTKDHSEEDMEKEENRTGTHYVESWEYNDKDPTYDELYGDLFNVYEPYDSPDQEDNQYPDDDSNYTGDGSSGESTSDTDDPKPDDCPTVNCPSYYRVKRVKAGTCDCEKEKLWYTDNDKDDWYAAVKSSIDSPGPGWIQGTPKGQDCDDNNKLVYNTCAGCKTVKELFAEKVSKRNLMNFGKTEEHTGLGLTQESSYGGGDKTKVSPNNSELFTKAPTGKYNIKSNGWIPIPYQVTINLYNNTNTQLLQYLSNTLHLSTLSGTNEEKSADLIMDYFSSKKGGVLYNPYLGPTIRRSDGSGNSDLDGLINSIQKQLCDRKDEIVCPNTSLNLTAGQVRLPSFGFDTPILKSQLGGTQGIELETDANGNLQMYLYDTFGVDENDTVKDNFTTVLEIAGAIKGIRAMWVLQQQRGYKPFLMKTPLSQSYGDPRSGTIIPFLSMDKCK